MYLSPSSCLSKFRDATASDGPGHSEFRILLHRLFKVLSRLLEPAVGDGHHSRSVVAYRFQRGS